MTDPRDDLYLVAALLADIDRVLNPLALEERGDLAATPVIPPPMPPVTPRGAPPRSSGSSAPPRRSASSGAAAVPPVRAARPTPTAASALLPTPPRQAPAPPRPSKPRAPKVSVVIETAVTPTRSEQAHPVVVGPSDMAAQPRAVAVGARAATMLPRPSEPSGTHIDDAPAERAALPRTIAAPAPRARSIPVPPRRIARSQLRDRELGGMESRTQRDRPVDITRAEPAPTTHRRGRHVPPAKERRTATRIAGLVHSPIRPPAVAAVDDRALVMRDVHATTTMPPALPRRRVERMPEHVDDVTVDPSPPRDPVEDADAELGFELELADNEYAVPASSQFRLRGGRMVVTGDAEIVARAERRLTRLGRLRGKRL